MARDCRGGVAGLGPARWMPEVDGWGGRGKRAAVRAAVLERFQEPATALLNAQPPAS